MEKFPQRRTGDIQVFSPEEVMALVRAADSEQDDFGGSVIRVRASFAQGHLTTPKSGRVRWVPMASHVARALAQLGQRSQGTGEADLVFLGDWGGYVDGSALRRRYEAALARAGLRGLRFHDLRHTFGARMIGKADIRRVQEWMGHADIQTTMSTCTTRHERRTPPWWTKHSAWPGRLPRQRGPQARILNPIRRAASPASPGSGHRRRDRRHDFAARALSENQYPQRCCHLWAIAIVRRRADRV